MGAYSMFHSFGLFGVIIVVLSETVFYYIAQDGCEFTIVLNLPPECRNFKSVPKPIVLLFRAMK